MILKHLMSGALISEKARVVDPSHSPFTLTLGKAGDPAAGCSSLPISSKRAHGCRVPADQSYFNEASAWQDPYGKVSMHQSP